MTRFNEWCFMGPTEATGSHHARVLVSRDDATGVAGLITTLPNSYAESASLALVATRFGKAGVAKFLSNKLPTKANARSGDMGEILATSYLREECGTVVGPSRLIDRDHQEWAMRGDDVLGAKVGANGSVHLTKVEAKSRAALGKRTVEEAREGLGRNDELPNPQSLTQFAERLLGTVDNDIGEAVLDLLLLDDVRPDRVEHIMFLFTGNDPSAHVAADLKGYSGAVSQLTITLRVQAHQNFIREVYEGATADGA